jgi:hypothetical protein
VRIQFGLCSNSTFTAILTHLGSRSPLCLYIPLILVALPLISSHTQHQLLFFDPNQPTASNTMTSFDISSKDDHREITFYCLELDKHNTNKFLITPSMTWDHTIRFIKNDLRKALDGADPEIWPLDMNGEPFYDCENKLYNFDAIKKGEHLIISCRIAGVSVRRSIWRWCCFLRRRRVLDFRRH